MIQSFMVIHSGGSMWEVKDLSSKFARGSEAIFMKYTTLANYTVMQPVQTEEPHDKE